jgi:hypothetical protein
MESQKYITYLLLFVLICIVLIIINGLYDKKLNNKNNIETFFTSTAAETIPITTLAPSTTLESSTTLALSTTLAPSITSNPIKPLIPILKSSTDSLNELRFSWIDNQQKIDDITTRINTANKNLVGLSHTPMYSASGTLTFY